MRVHTNISLDHLTALSSDPGDEAKDIHLPLGDHHVQHSINHNEGARPPHPGADRKVESQTVHTEQQIAAMAAPLTCNAPRWLRHTVGCNSSLFSGT